MENEFLLYEIGPLRIILSFFVFMGIAVAFSMYAPVLLKRLAKSEKETSVDEELDR